MEKYLNSMLMDNKTIVEQPIRLEGLASRLTDKSIEFIEKTLVFQNYDISNPTETKSKQQEMMAIQTQKPFALFHSFTNVHTPLITGKDFRGKAPQNYGEYGDSVIEMDHQVCLINYGNFPYEAANAPSTRKVWVLLHP